MPSWLVIVCVLNADGHMRIELAYGSWYVRYFFVVSHWVEFVGDIAQEEKT